MKNLVYLFLLFTVLFSCQNETKQPKKITLPTEFEQHICDTSIVDSSNVEEKVHHDKVVYTDKRCGRFYYPLGSYNETKTRIASFYVPDSDNAFTLEFFICLEEKTTLESLTLSIDGELLQFDGQIQNPTHKKEPPYCLYMGGFYPNSEQNFLQLICSAKKVFFTFEIDKEKRKIPFTKEQIASLTNIYAMSKVDFNGL